MKGYPEWSGGGEGNPGMIGIEERPAMAAARPMRLDAREDMAGMPTIDGLNLRAWKEALGKDLDRSIASGPWPTAFVGVAWIHLLSFTACQAVYDPAIVTDWR